MRFRRHTQLEHGLTQIDIAPLIDMVFQLLIFFMLTSSFVLQPGIRVKLPKAVTSEFIPQESLIITVSRENVIYLNERVVNPLELKSYLKQATKKQVPILIKADRKSSVGRVVEVWDICRESGISKINIATDRD